MTLQVLLRLLVLLLLSASCSIHAFTRSLTFQTRRQKSVVLFYKDDGKDDDDDNDMATASAKKHRKMAIPVLGPLPGQPPLGMGCEMKLESPTPLQWQALEETAYIHQQHYSSNETASIHAAPLIAIMDDYSAGDVNLHSSQKGRYATIAAIVGFSMPSKNENLDSDDDDNNKNKKSSESFMESLYNHQGKTPRESTVRMVGIGRAVLHDFYYQAPTSVREMMDEEGHLIVDEDVLPMLFSNKDDKDEEEEEEEDDNIHDDSNDNKMNIVMARFTLLMDRADRSNEFSNKHGHKRAGASSPVHALAEMNSWVNKLQYLHADRRRLVAGLHTARARLQLKGGGLWDDLQDWDGLGALFGADDFEQEHEEMAQTAIEGLLEEFPPHDSTATADAAEEEEESLLAGLENYGLGYSAASFSNLRDLGSVLMEKLQPYYSPEYWRESEEFQYEMLSFVAMQSMEKFLEPTDLGWSLRCTNTIERLEQAYSWMLTHVRLLKEEADRVSQKLRDCGEECTDLW